MDTMGGSRVSVRSVWGVRDVRGVLSDTLGGDGGGV